MSRVHQITLFCLVCLLWVGLGDGRVLADNIAQPPPFAQDWNNPNLITANDDWAGVPGIMGFQGDALTGGAGTDPQTILVDDITPTIDVIANQTNPNITNGGVAEFELVNNVVALQGSAMADAPYLLIHLNTLNYTNIQVAYNLRDIDGSADDAIQPVALHYRVGGSGNFANIPAAYVADATTGPAQATLVTPISVTLPAAADNQPLVMLRIMTTNAVGNDEWVGIDDLTITGTFSDFPPVVSSHSPAANVIGQAVDVPITVTFNEEVTITGDVPVFCSLSGAQNATPSSGDNLTYTLTHADFLPDESCTVTLPAAQVTDDDTDDPPDNMAADYTWRFSTGFAIINEIHADPDPVNGDANGDGVVATFDDEFVEIVNMTGADLDISGWTLSDAVGIKHIFPANTIIPDGCAIVIFGGGTPTGSFGSAQVQIASSSTLALNNAGDTITLHDGTEAQAIVSYGSEGNNNQSLTRDPDIIGLLPLVQHSTAVGSNGAIFSPGTQINGNQFAGCYHCGQPATRIHAIQGSGMDSLLAGQVYTIEGVVVGDFQAEATIRGFYVQEEDGDVDGDPATSEGLFVYDNFPALWVNVNVGQRVRATGTVTEYVGLTELSQVYRVAVCGDTAVPTPLTLTLPFSSTTFLERAEGMLVTLPQPLTVNENYFLGRYGELVLSNGRLAMPTNVVSPGLPAQTMLADNLRNMLILDDGRAAQNPDPIIHPAPGLTAVNTIRGGDSVSDLTGILTYSWSGFPGTDNYRLHPTTTPTHTSANPRLAAPMPISGTLRVASFNVLNYFNGDGLGGGFPTSRGASSPEEFTRQRDKIIPAILALDADIIGLMEIENDGYDPTSAIADLVDGLNAAAGPGIYAYVNPGLPTLGSDEIAVGLIYRPTAVTLISVATDNTGAFAARNRQPLAATFTAGGETFTVVVNHLKSKGADCNDGTTDDPDDAFPDDPDTGDGQGNCNLTRTIAAMQLHNWLATDPTNSSDPDLLIIGDLNAYAREDPIIFLRGSGYTNLAANIHPGVYSYVFGAQAGQLDYALSSPSLTAQVVGATIWHNNADEPSALDYNMENKTAGQLTSLYNADPYRAADHDPVIVGLTLGAAADYSDLDSVYGTAWHVGSGVIRLGTAWDPDIVHTFGADDASDDGVQRGPGSGPGGQWQPGPDGGSLDIAVTGSGNGCLYAWIDWDQDGRFDDSDTPENLEYIIRGATTGSGNYSFEVPAGAFDPPPGPPTPTRAYHLRVRLYAACGSGPTGVAVEGEVEDYRLVFTPTAVTLQSFRTQTAVAPWLLLLLMMVCGVVVWGYGRRRS